MWEVTVMGSGQDAGVPQVGCSCRQCRAARADTAFKRLAPSLLAKNEATGQAVVIDASPDLREQLDRYLPPLGLSSIQALFITHGHIGHYWGLPLLGKEGPDLRGVRTYAPPEVVDMLLATPAFSFMVSRGNVQMVTVHPGKRVSIGDLTVEGFYVPHRQELTSTMGFLLRGPKRSLIYIPDIDRWTPETIAAVKAADVALLDGTFFSADELGETRAVVEIPHPPIRDSLELFKDGRRTTGSTNIYFTHLNHTNPAGLDGTESDAVRRAGLDITFDGMRVAI